MSAQATAAGAVNVVIESDVDRRSFGASADSSKQILLKATVSVRATGKPDLQKR